LAVRSLAALDDIAPLLDALNDKDRGDLRAWAADSLRYWIGCSRDNDYRLFDALKDKYKPNEAENVGQLLHKYGGQDVLKPETYEKLIGLLNEPKLPIRDLAYWHLALLVPQGRKIAYSPVDPPDARARAQAEWRKLIPPGKLPPTAK